MLFLHTQQVLRKQRKRGNQKNQESRDEEDEDYDSGEDSDDIEYEDDNWKMYLYLLILATSI